MKRLLTVEDTFAITGRGLMVAPMPALDEIRGPGEIDVELRLPDGTRRSARMSVRVEFVHPTPAIRRWACLFEDLAKPEVPIGTEILVSGRRLHPTTTDARAMTSPIVAASFYPHEHRGSIGVMKLEQVAVVVLGLSIGGTNRPTRCR